MALGPVARFVRRTSWGVGLATALAVLAFTPVHAADPPESMSGMPDPAAVSAGFTGADALDTAAIQFAALERLDEIAGKLLPNDRVATPAEIQFQHAYSDAWSALVRQVRSGLPSDQQAYAPGTRFTARYGQVDHYRADAAFDARFRTLFPTSFVAAHASLLNELDTAGRSPSTPALAPPAPPVTTQLTTGLVDAVPSLVPLLVALALLWLAGVRPSALRQPQTR